ncbi:AlpA family transcriptional regulator [Frankia sp. CiP3]|uniref:helix-turn-helix transcriptional regulator n=1 Tax=Frankia sp. CiP3 TaxID=2880971 RepID=UPI001EF73695|nr:helix-turn-helix domain-containing protein [Frankia sp. CiP3]
MVDEQLWSTGDIAQRLKISTERARQLSHRAGFPAHVQQARHIRLWRAADVEAWISEHRPGRAVQEDPGPAQDIGSE